VTKSKITLYGQALLISAEVCLIVFADLSFGHILPIEMARYISLDVLFCLPILQTAKLAAIRASRQSDPQIATFVAISLALVWSATEVSIAWPDFPIVAFIWNSISRSVAFAIIGRILIKLWRERYYSHTDMLTGLANRRNLMGKMRIEQKRSDRSGKPYSLLFIDIDNFKAVNDLQGHQAGDEALTTLAGILSKCARKADLVARLGGDEFVLLLPETDDPPCDALIERIETASKRAFKEKSWPISVSIGRTTHIGTTHEVNAVIQLADRNMYEAKQIKQQLLQAGVAFPLNLSGRG